MSDLNFYGLPIVPPELFDRPHRVAVAPAVAGLPPICSCGWTRHEVNGHWYELCDHLHDMNGEEDTE